MCLLYRVNAPIILLNVIIFLRYCFGRHIIPFIFARCFFTCIVLVRSFLFVHFLWQYKFQLLLKSFGYNSNFQCNASVLVSLMDSLVSNNASIIGAVVFILFNFSVPVVDDSSVSCPFMCLISQIIIIRSWLSVALFATTTMSLLSLLWRFTLFLFILFPFLVVFILNSMYEFVVTSKNWSCCLIINFCATGPRHRDGMMSNIFAAALFLFR